MRIDWFRDKFYDHIGGPFTAQDWYYIGIVVCLSIFMGMMVPVWMDVLEALF